MDKYIPTQLFKQAVFLSKQARAIEAAIDGITPLNTGKKKADTNIPQHEIEAFAHCLLPEIQKFFESPEGRKDLKNGKRRGNRKQKEKERMRKAAVSLTILPLLLI